MRTALLFKLWNLWPPFLFSGIRIQEVASDYRRVVVRLKLRFWNANYVGTQYGGLLFSMADPFYMVMLILNLGPDYVVWDKSSHIEYLKPGRTDVTAEFSITEDDLSAIRSALETAGSFDWRRQVDIKDIHGTLIARVDKVIHIKKKRKEP
jgi:acyl-coenzyme A thioesterase PaaI-like protein